MSFDTTQEALLDPILQRFFVPLGLRVVTAAEIEFYTEATDQLSALSGIAKLEQERGEGQYEVAFGPASPHQTVIQLSNLKQQLSGIANFFAKPFSQQPASGLHINVHLEGADGKNPFFKDDDATAPELEHSIAGLLAIMRETMLAYAPSDTSYARLTPRGQTPTTISWGANNRTVAVRLPDTGTHTKRIEHRVAGADADAELVMACVLAGIGYGLQEKLKLTLPQIYGDATLDQYELEKLPATLEEAKQAALEATILPRVFPPLAARLQAIAQNG